MCVCVGGGGGGKCARGCVWVGLGVCVGVEEVRVGMFVCGWGCMMVGGVGVRKVWVGVGVGVCGGVVSYGCGCGEGKG